jgi:hypothetical protein
MSTEVAAPAEATAVVHRTTALDRRPCRRRPGRQDHHDPPAAPVQEGPLLLLLALVLVVGGGVGAWWFGWERYTSAPAVLGMMQNPAEKKLEAAGLTVEVGDPAYSETVPEGACSAPTRRPATGCSTAARSRSWSRWARSGTTSRAPRARRSTRRRTPARRPPRLRQGHRALVREVPEGTVLRSDPPAGQTLRPGTVVDLYVSKGRKPLTVTDWTGKNFVEARTALERKGFEVSSTDEYSDTVANGRRHLAEPRRGHAVPRRPGRLRGLVGARAGRGARGAGGLGLGVGPGEPSRQPGSWWTSSTSSDYLGLGLRLQRRPRVGHGPPQGIHGHPLAHLGGREAQTLLATLTLLAITAAWGSTFFLIKDLLERVPTLDFLGVRFAIAGVALVLVAPRALGRLSREARRHAIVLGLLYGLGQILQTAGLAHTPASVSGFITGLYVVATPLFAAVLLHTRITWLTWAAVVLAAVGLGRPDPRRALGRVRRGAHLRRRDALRAAHRGPGGWSTATDAMGWRSSS